MRHSHCVTQSFAAFEVLAACLPTRLYVCSHDLVSFVAAPGEESDLEEGDLAVPESDFTMPAAPHTGGSTPSPARVQGAGCRVQGGRVQGAGCRVQAFITYDCLSSRRGGGMAAPAA